MDVKIDIPEWLKISLHILLPALWIFGCLVLFLPDTILEKNKVLSWRNENGFWIGVGFLIVTCLLIIYVVYFGITFIRSAFLNITRNRRKESVCVQSHGFILKNVKNASVSITERGNTGYSRKYMEGFKHVRKDYVCNRLLCYYDDNKIFVFKRQKEA